MPAPGFGRRWRPARAPLPANCSGFGPAAGATDRCRPTTGSPSSAARLDAYEQPGRHAGRVVPAPVRRRAARPQLGEPEGPRGVRGRAAVLVRPRRRRRTHRLGRLAHEGPDARRLRSGQPAVPAPVQRPGRGARRLPRLARDRRLLRRTAGTDRRGVAARRAAVRGVPAPGRDPHRVQLRVPRLRLGRGGAAYGHRRDARRTRTGRRAGHLGAVQPRRAAARDPLRSRRHLVHARLPATRRAHRSGTRHSAGPRGHAAHPRAARFGVPVPG